MKIDFHSKFAKKLRKFPKSIQEQFYNKLAIFEIDPFAQMLNNHAVHYPYEGCRSINISGDVRALYEVIVDTALFVRIGSHSELYK